MDDITRTCDVCHRTFADGQNIHHPHNPNCPDRERCDCDFYTCGACCWECHPLREEDDDRHGGADYVLAAQDAWVTVKCKLTVHIIETDEGVVVDIYPLDKEDEAPIASTYAHFA